MKPRIRVVLAFLATFLVLWVLELVLAGLSGSPMLRHLPFERPALGAVLLFPAAYSLGICVLALSSRARSRDPAPSGRAAYSILIAAADEEQVLARTLASITAQVPRGTPIHLVSDGSRDRTVEVAQRFAERGVVVHVSRQRVGKSRALDIGLSAIETPIVIGLDADTVPELGAIERLAATMRERPGVGAVAGRIEVVRDDASTPVPFEHHWLRAAQAFEYRVVIGLSKRAEDCLGALFTVSGAAAAYDVECVRAVGGFTSVSATEDIDLSWRLQRAGFAIRYADDAVFRVLTPPTLRALFSQRIRWACGLAQVFFSANGLFAARRTSFGAILALVMAGFVYVPALVVSLVLVPLMSTFGGLAESFEWGAVTRLGLEAFFLQALVGYAIDERSVGAQCGRASSVASALIGALTFPLYWLFVLLPSFVIGAVRGIVERESTGWERTSRSLRPEGAPQFGPRLAHDLEDDATPIDPIAR